ncbi:hypothetical protein EG347_15360 [Chryseobacterium sp. G0186]|nr:hypothetical protein EG347_15360 [Chryseobacterium sp. G0186]
MSNIYLFFKLKRSYLEHFKFTAFFLKGGIRLNADHCQLIEIFNGLNLFSQLSLLFYIFTALQIKNLPIN